MRWNERDRFDACFNDTCLDEELQMARVAKARKDIAKQNETREYYNYVLSKQLTCAELELEKSRKACRGLILELISN